MIKKKLARRKIKQMTEISRGCSKSGQDWQTSCRPISNYEQLESSAQLAYRPIILI